MQSDNHSSFVNAPQFYTDNWHDMLHYSYSKQNHLGHACFSMAVFRYFNMFWGMVFAIAKSPLHLLVCYSKSSLKLVYVQYKVGTTDTADSDTTLA